MRSDLSLPDKSNHQARGFQHRAWGVLRKQGLTEDINKLLLLERLPVVVTLDFDVSLCMELSVHSSMVYVKRFSLPWVREL